MSFIVGPSANLSVPISIANGGTGTSSTTYANLTSNVTGTLPVANGGTGASTLTANNVIVGNGTSAVQFVAPSTSGNVLMSNGTTWTSSAPTGGNYTLLQNITVSTPSSSIDLTGLSDTYAFYRILFYIPAGGGSYLNLNIQLLDSSSNPLPVPTATGRTYYCSIGLGSENVASPFTARNVSSTVGFYTVNNNGTLQNTNPMLIDFTVVKSLDGVRPSHGISGTIWGNQSTYPVPTVFAGGYGTYDTPTSNPNLRGIRLNNTFGGSIFNTGSSIQLWAWKTTG